MSSKRYRAAVIGCGRVAWLLDNDPLIPEKPCSHAGAYQACERVEISAAADCRSDRLHDFAQQYHVENLYHDYEEMLKKEKPDIVSICAYANERYRMVCDCIRAGVKGIWCEKAFAASLREADEMVSLSDQYGAEIIVSHMRRWDPDYQRAKKLIAEGAIGEPISAVCHFSGSMLHTGTHAFDVLRYFFGDADWVEGHLEDNSSISHHNAFDSADQLITRDVGGYALIYFKSGLYATVHGDSKGYFIFEFDIIGSEGRIKIGNRLLEVYCARESPTESGLIELQRQEVVADKSKNIWTEAANNLLDAIEGRASNMSTAEDGRAALEIALAVHQSDRNSGERVLLPMEDKTLKVLSR